MSNPSDQDVAPKPIAEIAAQLGLDEKSVEPYGRYAGKLSLGLHARLAARPTGKYIGVTAVNPTPFGEAKTVVSIGLAMAIARRRHRSIVTLRDRRHQRISYEHRRRTESAEITGTGIWSRKCHADICIQSWQRRLTGTGGCCD